MEVLIVVAVIAILSAVAYPLLRGPRAELKISGGARGLENLMQKARVMASSQQNSIRVVINCGLVGIDSCYVDLQTAVLTDSAVTGWRLNYGERQVLDSSVQIAKKPATTHDGAVSQPNIFWSIFMPTGQVYSDPRPFELFLSRKADLDANKSGWWLEVNNVTGRVYLRRGKQLDS
jgi:type II secretory pathway pseudopilin PulG